MTWTQAQAGALMQLAENRSVSHAELQSALQRAPLQPAPQDWLRMAQRVLGMGGALLLAVGVIFFFAYNWDELNRFARLALAFAALLGCAAGAWFSPPGGMGWRAALSAAVLCTGALLALIGQTYQTGADIWELFAAWAALGLPLVLLSRSSAAWSIWLLVFNTALYLALMRPTLSWFWWLGTASMFTTRLMLVAVCNLALWVALEFVYRRLLHVPRRYIVVLAAIATMMPLGLAVAWSWWDKEFPVLLYLVYAACTVSALVVYGRWRQDAAMLAVVCLTLVAVGASALAWLSPPFRSATNSLLMALFLIASSGAAAVWIRRVHAIAPDDGGRGREARGAPTAARTPRPSTLVLEQLEAAGVISAKQLQQLNARQGTPWWLAALLAVAAWMASLLVMTGIGTMLMLNGRLDPYVTTVCAVVFLSGALFWMRASEHIFAQQCALVMSLSGQALFLMALWDGWRLINHDVSVFLAAAALAGILTLPRTPPLHRSVCAVVALGSLLIGLRLAAESASMHFWRDVLAFMGAALGAAACLLWLRRPAWGRRAPPDSGWYKAWARGLGIMAAMLALPLMYAVLMDRFNWWSGQIQGGGPGLFSGYTVGAICLFLGVCAWLLHRLKPRGWQWLGGAAVVLAVAGTAWPGVLIAIALALALFQACQRAGFMLMMLWLVAIVGNYYYDMHHTLLFKSLSMMIMGAVLLAVRYILLRNGKEQA